MANNKSNIKVIKISPEVDVAASNKAKQEIKKLFEELNFKLTGVGKGLTGSGVGGLNKASNEAVRNIIKEFEKLNPALQKEVKSGYGEIASFFKSIQRDFVKENTNLCKEAKRNLKEIRSSLESLSKAADKAYSSFRKLSDSTTVKILDLKPGGKGSGVYANRLDRQRTYESLFADPEGMYNDFVLKQKRTKWLSQIRQRKQNELIGASINRNTEKYDLMNKEKYYQDVFSEGNLISYYTNVNKKHREAFERMMEPGNKVLQDFSRRVKIYFSYKAIDLFTNSITGAVDSLVKLQSAFANIQAITASTNGQMEKIRKSVFEVGVNTRFATEEIADAAVVLGQAGLSTKEISSVLEHTATLASATGEDLKNTAGLMTSVLSIWNMNADQASHVADVFVTSANDTKATLDSLSYGVQYAGTSLAQLGVSFEETSAVMAASTNAGLKSSSMLGTGMRALATELTNQSKRMKETLASLGLTFDDVDIKSLGLIKVLKNLKEAGFGATEAFAAFDRRAATYALAALSELDTAEKLTDAFNQNGAAAKANATQMATLESQLISLRDIVAKDLSTTFRVITGFFTKLLTGINVILKVWDGFLGKIIVSSTSIIGFTTAFRSLNVVLKKTKDFFTGYFGLKELTTKVDVFTKSMINLGIAQQKAVFWGRLLKLTLGGFAIALGTIAFEWYLKNFKSLGDQIAELNETMETHRSTVNSTTSDLEELSNKEKLYTSDVEALNKRIAELNRKYAETGFVQKYANETDNLKDKLLELRDAIAEVRKEEDLRRAKAREEAADKRIQKIESDIDSITPAINPNRKVKLRDFIINTKNQLDDLLSKNDIVGAKNYLLSAKSEYSELLPKVYHRKDEHLQKRIEEFESLFSQYISAKFEKVRSELDRLGREEELRGEYDTYENLIRKQTNNYSSFVETSFKNIMEALSKGKTIDDESITKAISSVNDYIENILLKNLEHLKSDMESKGLIHTSGYANLLTAMSKYGKKDSWRAFLPKDLKEMGEGAFKDNQLSRSGYESIFGAIKLSLEELRKKNLKDERNQQRSTPFLDLRRNELSNIGESTKAAKKARDIRLKGFGYTTGLTSAAQGLYKGYSDEMSLLESALNAERYAKILKELEKEYDYVRTKKEDLSKVEVTALDLMKDTENKLVESKESYQILTGKTYEYGASLEDLRVKYADLRMKTEELTSASTTGWNGFLEGFKNKYKEMSEQVRKNGSISNQIGELVYTSGISGMENALISICDRTKSVSDAFREMLADILKEIRNFLIKQAVQQFFMAMGSALFSSAGTTTTLPNGTTIHTTGVETLGPGVTTQGGSISSGFVRKAAAGGVVQGGIKGRDSVHTMLMPGEYVMKKSAVDVLGTKFFNSLNTNAAQTMNTVGAMMGGASMEYQGEPSVVNVWVVSEKDEAKMGPNDVIATISKDLQTGGTTKKLIQTIVAGRKA